MRLIGVKHWHQKWECVSQVKYLTGSLCQLPVLEAPWTRSGVNINAELHQLKELSLTEPGSSRTCFTSIDKGPFSFFQGKRSIQEGRRKWVFCHPLFVIPLESSTKCCPAWWNHFLSLAIEHLHSLLNYAGRRGGGGAKYIIIKETGEKETQGGCECAD